MQPCKKALFVASALLKVFVHMQHMLKPSVHNKDLTINPSARDLAYASIFQSLTLNAGVLSEVRHTRAEKVDLPEFLFAC